VEGIIESSLYCEPPLGSSREFVVPNDDRNSPTELIRIEWLDLSVDSKLSPIEFFQGLSNYVR
jgi:hypothetical protein